MISKAKFRYIRISPRKANEVIKLIRGKNVGFALSLLSSLNKKASIYLIKLINSALSNARNSGVDTTNLDNIYISKLIVNPGPVLKRYREASFGRAMIIRKRTAHLEIELDSSR